MFEKLILLSPSANHSSPTAEWPSPRPIRRRTCRTHPSTATMTAAWRSQRRPAPSHRQGRGLARWRCRRTTTSGPRPTAALARWSTRRTVRPGGVSPPSTPLSTSSTSSIHQHTLTKTNKHSLLSHTLTLSITHTRCTVCQNAVCQQECSIFNQTPRIPCTVYTFVKEVCDLTAAQHNQYAT